jgi:uncharacterized SAM-binding protein YcdF (DUF218 family)
MVHFRSTAWHRGIAPATVVVAIVLAVAARHAGTALVVNAFVRPPDAIVSLASHEWERLPAAIALARQYPHALVVLTHPKTVTRFNCHDCANRPQLLVNAGISGERIVIVGLTRGGTYGEAVATRDLVVARHFSSVLVVTSPYHTRRSLATFRKVLGGGVAVGIAASSNTSPARPERWWVAGYDRAYVAYEWAAALYYQLRYGVPISLPESPLPVSGKSSAASRDARLRRQ